MRVIELTAPIIPWQGIGNVKLYAHITDFYEIIEQFGDQPQLLGKFLVRYEIGDAIDLWFNILNGKLFKITALRQYTGKLFGEIGIGMPIDKVLEIEPSFIYDDFEEVYCSPKGVFIETDPVEKTVLWISTYIKEIENANFEMGDW